MHNPAFLITIDTEGDNLWQKHDSITTENARYLPRFQQLCEKYGFKPVYLTNYEMAIDPFYIEFARDVIARGTAEVGMHLHAWNSPPTEPLTADDWRHKPYLIEYSDAMMREKVDYMTRLLEDTFQTKMVSHRAGRWAFDERYARLLVEYGYQVDCSVTPRVNWKTAKGAPQGDGGTDYRRFPQHAYFLDENDISREGTLAAAGSADEHPVQALSVDEQREAGLRPPARQSAIPLRTLAATDGRQCGDDEKSRRTNVDAGQ